MKLRNSITLGAAALALSGCIPGGLVEPGLRAAGDLLSKLVNPSASSQTALAPSSQIAPTAARAQLGVDVNGAVNFGTLELQRGFMPDPRSVEIVSGGDVSVGNLGGGCIGNASSEPDVRMFYETDGQSPLTVAAMSEEGDVSLVINRPDGSWICDDDSAGDLNALIQMDRPMSGRYEIWVASVGSTDNFRGTLFVTERRN